MGRRRNVVSKKGALQCSDCSQIFTNMALHLANNATCREQRRKRRNLEKKPWDRQTGTVPVLALSAPGKKMHSSQSCQPVECLKDMVVTVPSNISFKTSDSDNSTSSNEVKLKIVETASTTGRSSSRIQKRSSRSKSTDHTKRFCKGNEEIGMSVTEHGDYKIIIDEDDPLDPIELSDTESDFCQSIDLAQGVEKKRSVGYIDSSSDEESSESQSMYSATTNDSSDNSLSPGFPSNVNTPFTEEQELIPGTSVKILKETVMNRLPLISKSDKVQLELYTLLSDAKAPRKLFDNVSKLFRANGKDAFENPKSYTGLKTFLRRMKKSSQLQNLRGFL